ncbi:MAG: hypothetical protein KatS3mg050_1907 [Litorilinea sp.]|nr:MAG: hypothetical protein KatS3mg050_1907 [Litorilinea sp.]
MDTPVNPLEPAFVQSSVPILRLAEPILVRGYGQLLVGIQPLIYGQPTCPFDPAHLMELYWRLLPIHLLPRVRAILVQESERTGKAVGLLLQQLNRPEAVRAILRRHPDRARQLHATVDAWAEAGVQFIHRLQQDWPQLCRHFAGGDSLGLPTQVERHQPSATGLAADEVAGPAALCIHFVNPTNGVAVRLIYEPQAQDVCPCEIGAGPPVADRPALYRGPYAWRQEHGP